MAQPLVQKSSSLPAHFTSLYRLILRGCSASVGHRPSSAKILRSLYRPVFVEAAQNLREYETPGADHQRKAEIERWMKNWHAKMDNTLAFFVDASTTYGTSFKMLMNLVRVIKSRQAVIALEQRRRTVKWNPRLDTELYAKIAERDIWSKATKKVTPSELYPHTKRMGFEESEEGKAKAEVLRRTKMLVDEAITLAARSSEISLGRLQLDKWGRFIRDPIDKIK
ncbi:hypothetical protein FRC02_006131 [Tulasnella sp. 418]|nr:hypothetical protein FRC02_006131 [Tulasnella sp. 418]